MSIDHRTKPSRRWSHRLSTSISALAAMLFGATAAGDTALVSQSTALWRVVHDLCVVDKRAIGLPSPCTAVDLRAGIAVVTDAGGPTGYLVVPTKRLTGIEDPALLKPHSPNYWQAAWDARRYVARKASGKLGRDTIAIAVNSVAGRTQNQLHFHVDCVQAEVKNALSAWTAKSSSDWTALTLRGHPYWMRTLVGPNLGLRDPFKMLAESDRVAASSMGRQTLVIVGAELPQGPGFYIIRGSTSQGNRGHGEELLDHQCREIR